ncbi:2-keto-4-pentenoate hydratase [Marinobacterium rhizophilum]|uniref:Fumarylacetoacetate hydrolase family protein n=1 Tax=Marinobacterium rhizophilum TaxID=420402 RepID=A0ABY5HHB2_9GAMM|nr:fumarylacetoacetate hydrolase family protein [Marinobacterium rhizophilum]UTW11743.1 fumarylacetoacetate hydrolase family protein [Marinobacterium rhizophilum]
MSLTQTQVEQAAELFLQAYRSGQQIEDLPPALEPQSKADAYAIQAIVAAARCGAPVRTWKVGAPNLDTEPYAAPIFESVVSDSPTLVPAEKLHMIGIEVELAYRFSQDLPPRAQPYSVDEVAAAVEGVYVVIEVVDTRLKAWKTCAELWKLADNQINAALIVGNGVQDWRALDPATLAGELIVDGKVLVRGQGAHSVGDPMHLVHWTANHLTGRNGGLKQGDLVTTGTWTGMQFVEPGAEVVGRFEGVGEARVGFPL